MSDIDTEEYREPTQEQIRSLLNPSAPPSGSNYVAKPAPGYDVKGMWHCFKSEQRHGLSTAAVALHEGLSLLGIKVELVPHRHHAIDFEKFPDDRAEKLRKWMGTPVGLTEALIATFPLAEAAEMYNQAPALVPYVEWRGGSLSDEEVKLCNGETFTRIWTMSNAASVDYTQAGVTREKTRVLLPPVCSSLWGEFGDAPTAIDDTFRFGAACEWEEAVPLVTAYFGNFRRDQKVSLQLHCPLPGRTTVREFKAQIAETLRLQAATCGDDDFPASRKMPHIAIHVGDETDADLIAWIRTLDCFVDIYDGGQGFCAPSIWSLACGIPILSYSPLTATGAFSSMCAELLRKFENGRSTYTPSGDLINEYRAESDVWQAEARDALSDLLGDRLHHILEETQ